MPAACHNRDPATVGASEAAGRNVRFGMNFDPDKHFHFVLINPGFSHLTARQILDRLLGII